MNYIIETPCVARLKVEILNGHVHTIEEMKAWLKPLGNSNIDRINAIRRENKICFRVTSGSGLHLVQGEWLKVYGYGRKEV